MSRYFPCVMFLVLAGGLTVTAQSTERGAAPGLTAAEQSAGWRLLFDGTTTKGWRGFKKPEFPASGWMVDEGRLKHVASGGQPAQGGGDIITTETFDDFELRFE